MDTTTQTEYPIATRWEMITGEEPPADLSRIPAEQAEELVRLFAPLAQAVNSLAPDARAIVVQDESDEAGMADARRLRLAIRQSRLEAEKIHKEQKAWSLMTGRLVDWFKKQVTEPATALEDHLEEQEKYAEIQEFNRRTALSNARLEILRPIADDLSAFGDLAAMSDEAFEKLRAMLQDAHDKAEAAAAERKRLEDEQRAETERLRQENERLRAELAAGLPALETMGSEAPPAPAETYMTITVDDESIGFHGAGSFAYLFRDVEDFEESLDKLLAGIRRDLVGLKRPAEVAP